MGVTSRLFAVFNAFAAGVSVWAASDHIGYGGATLSGLLAILYANGVFE